jgi:hypothetical protein
MSDPRHPDAPPDAGRRLSQRGSEAMVTDRYVNDLSSAG